MRTLAWETVGSTVLVVHSRQLPSDADWQDFVAYCAKAPPGNQAVVFADVTLNAKQRRDIQRLHEATGTRKVAVVTDSMLTRVLVNTMNWLSNTHRAFALRDVEGALEHLDVSAQDRVQLIAAARKLAFELDLPLLEATLRQLVSDAA
jgi:hypothetical protein